MNNDKVAAMMLLKDSLAEAQVSVRAYDTKAQIVGVGYIFALNVVGQINKLLSTEETATTLTIIIAWMIVILPIMLFGYVLYPVRKSAVQSGDDSERKYMLFLHPERYNNVSELIDAAEGCDPSDEIAYELLKMSALRESKRKRFVRGLVAAAIAFLVLFANQVFVSAF